jgi:hypothetical protein
MKTASFVTLLSLLICCTSTARGQTLEWIRQLGTSSADQRYGVSADGLGSVYISGLTYGSLEGSSAGGSDAFVSKYDASGTLQWTRQLGCSDDDRSFGVSADGLGGVYISGWTFGSLKETSAGGSDAFVAKYTVPEPATVRDRADAGDGGLVHR